VVQGAAPQADEIDCRILFVDCGYKLIFDADLFTADFLLVHDRRLDLGALVVDQPRDEVLRFLMSEVEV